MDIFNKDIPTNTKELYASVCVEIIESNGLKEKALDIALKVCDMHIDKEPDDKKGTIYSILPTMACIKKELIVMKDELMGGRDEK